MSTILWKNYSTIVNGCMEVAALQKSNLKFNLGGRDNEVDGSHRIPNQVYVTYGYPKCLNTDVHIEAQLNFEDDYFTICTTNTA